MYQRNQGKTSTNRCSSFTKRHAKTLGHWRRWRSRTFIQAIKQTISVTTKLRSIYEIFPAVVKEADNDSRWTQTFLHKRQEAIKDETNHSLQTLNSPPPGSDQRGRNGHTFCPLLSHSDCFYWSLYAWTQRPLDKRVIQRHKQARKRLKRWRA